MAEQRILLVEDEPRMARIEMGYLQGAGFEVLLAKDGEEALHLFREKRPNLVILDLMIPKIPGEKVLQEIRKAGNIPVIVVSAKSEEEDRIGGLRGGADDYVTKPFSPRELVERIRAVLRRAPASQDEEVMVSDDGRIEILFDRTEVRKDGESVHLTKNEFLILKTLVSFPGKTFTRDEIIEANFGIEYDAYDRAIDTHIKNIRQKLEDEPRHPKYVKTVYGLGYKAGGFDEA